MSAVIVSSATMQRLGGAQPFSDRQASVWDWSSTSQETVAGEDGWTVAPRDMWGLFIGEKTREIKF
jgi:hypothetical protein